MIENQESDKIFWHKFDKFYEKILPIDAENILEIGVFKGDSIRYWREKYPKSYIVGIDILEKQESWPVDEKINYYELDQSDAESYSNRLNILSRQYDIVIEDGSHDPLHQKISLIQTIPFLKKDSIYILEDIHTSHKDHKLYQKRVEKLNQSKGLFTKNSKDYFLTLQCILFLEYLISNKKEKVEMSNFIDFKYSIFTEQEILLLLSKINKIDIFKRTTLPNYCYSCKTTNYNLNSLMCNCGSNLYEFADSMTAVLYF